MVGGGVEPGLARLERGRRGSYRGGSGAVWVPTGGRRCRPARCAGVSSERTHPQSIGLAIRDRRRAISASRSAAAC